MNKLTNIKIASLLSLVLSVTAVSANSFAQDPVTSKKKAAPTAPRTVKNQMDELDPFDPNIEQKLDQMDEEYELQTGKSASVLPLFLFANKSCYRINCNVWAQISRSQQKLFLYVGGQLVATWPVSTGIPGRDTPNFDQHPNGRIYDAYTSKKFPGGDYNGLGNMPYAVFISGGFAVHGTGVSNWKKLGRVASHGCIRVHPDNAYYFNRLVRANGINNVWITVQP